VHSAVESVFSLGLYHRAQCPLWSLMCPLWSDLKTKCAVFPLITFSNHLKYLTRQGSEFTTHLT